MTARRRWRPDVAGQRGRGRPDAHIGDTLHDRESETGATVRAVDYQVVSAGAEQVRVYSDDAADVAR